jgi:hypothetical protein
MADGSKHVRAAAPRFAFGSARTGAIHPIPTRLLLLRGRSRGRGDAFQSPPVQVPASFIAARPVSGFVCVLPQPAGESGGTAGEMLGASGFGVGDGSTRVAGSIYSRRARS